MNMQATVEGIKDDLTVAISAAGAAQEAYQMAALDHIEKRVSDKALDKAAEVLREADRRVRSLKAAQVAAEARDVRQAEETAAAALAAEKAAVQSKLREIHAAAQAWDSAVSDLVSVTQAYDAAVVALYALNPGATAINHVERTRASALHIIAHRLHPLVDAPNRPPFFPPWMQSLANHLPPLDEAVTQPAALTTPQE
jgi:hypothetical protein